MRNWSISRSNRAGESVPLSRLSLTVFETFHKHCERRQSMRSRLSAASTYFHDQLGVLGSLSQLLTLELAQIARRVSQYGEKSAVASNYQYAFKVHVKEVDGREASALLGVMEDSNENHVEDLGQTCDCFRLWRCGSVEQTASELSE